MVLPRSRRRGFTNTVRRCAHCGLQAVSSPEANTLGIGGVAGLDDDIEDQAAVAGDQVELVSVLRVAGTLDDDVGMRLEQA